MLLLDRRRVAALSLPALIGRCRSTPASYVADEKIRGSLPFPSMHTISFVPRGILTVVRTAALPSQAVDVSPSCQAHSGLREAFIARQSVPFQLTTL
jgi:hypothetical protein